MNKFFFNKQRAYVYVHVQADRKLTRHRNTEENTSLAENLMKCIKLMSHDADRKHFNFVRHEAR